MVVVDGWTVFAHPALLDQLEKLVAGVEKARAADPETFRGQADAKLLASLRKLIFETVPANPARPEYRQGDTLGKARTHWFRAKFGGGRFRLFFRVDGKAKIVIFAWVNDRDTLRTYGASTDAYAVFKKLLDKGNPPEDWAELLRAASSPAAEARLEAARPRAP